LCLSNLFCKLATSYVNKHIRTSPISLNISAITPNNPYDMKHTKLLLTLIFVIGFGIIASNAQQGVVSAGGEATGSGGTMSFSTGQTDFMYFYSETVSIQFGLQQAFFFDDEEGVPIERFLSTDDLVQGEDQCFDALETIILAGGSDTFIVEDGTGVDLIAGYSILMLPGSTVEYGGYLSAKISADGVFCDIEEPIVASLQVDQPDNTTYEEPLSSPDKKDSDFTLFRVYPNPTTGDFTVELTTHEFYDKPITIEVIGMRGETLKRITDNNQHQHQLSLHGHQPGVYMVRVQLGDVFGIERIIKRK
jgi:hypothetical protein